MKKFIIGLFCAIVTFSAMAKTTNWYVDGTLYQTSSCASGDDVTPPTAPAKRGYTFAGWLDPHFDPNLVMGSWSQSGTPGPTNPVYPTFYQDGDLILRAVGTDNLVADTYNIETGKITRRVGVKVLDGSEDWTIGEYANIFLIILSNKVGGKADSLCNAYAYSSGSQGVITTGGFGMSGNSSRQVFFKNTNYTTTTEWKQYLADQYAAGTPVTVYYPLETPTEEVYTPAQ